MIRWRFKFRSVTYSEVGFYFSQRDWRFPNFPITDVGFDNNRRGEKIDMPAEQAQQLWFDFYAYTISQLRELLTDYGKIDIIWFDGLGNWEAIENFKLDAKTAQTHQWMRSLQPGILINNRWGGKVSEYERTAGDFGTPEMHVPEEKIDGWWESCISIKGHWGYSPGRSMWSFIWDRGQIRKLAL